MLQGDSGLKVHSLPEIHIEFFRPTIGPGLPPYVANMPGYAIIHQHLQISHEHNKASDLRSL